MRKKNYKIFRRDKKIYSIKEIEKLLIKDRVYKPKVAGKKEGRLIQVRY